MKAGDLRKKSTDELKRQLSDVLRAQFNLRMQIATQQTTKFGEANKLRKDVARIYTLLREKGAR